MRWWQRLLGSPRLERDLDDELHDHVERAAAELVRAGMSEREAYRQARIGLGGLDQVKERCRDARGTRWLHDLGRDARFALRLLTREPGFSAVVVLVLGLSIGANAAIFTAAEAVLRRPLAYRDADRLVHLFERRADGSRHPLSYPEFDDWSRASAALARVASYDGGTVTLTAAGGPEQVTVARVTDGFFGLLGARAQLGRVFHEGEARLDGRGVVIGDGLWRRRFGGDPTTVGRSLRLDGRAHTIIGVLPADFEFPLRPGVDLWLPLLPSASQAARRDWHWLDVIARLEDGVTEQQAAAGLTAGRMLRGEPGWHATSTVRVVPIREEMVGSVRPVLQLLVVAVVLVLAGMCANVGGLLHVRSSTRRREFAVRTAVGAGRLRLIRQVLMETMVLTALGGAAGIAVGVWTLTLLKRAVPSGRQAALPHFESLALSPGMVGIVLALTVAVTFIVGLIPARRAAGADPMEPMRGGRGDARATDTLGRRALLAAEIAIAVVLLTGAGLLGRSVVRLQQASPGFEVAGLSTFRVALPSQRYPSDAASVAFYDRLLERLASRPDVSGAALINQLPLEGRGNSGNFAIRGRVTPADADARAILRRVSPTYFEVMGVPMRAGRSFTASDGPDGRQVVIVNDSFVRAFLASANPLGVRLDLEFMGERRFWDTVGVVGDEHFVELDEPPAPVIYFPFAQDAERQVTVVVRSSTPTPGLAADWRRVVAGLDPALPIYAVRSMEDVVAELPSVYLRRHAFVLVGAFASVALLLSALGVYMILARTVVDRTREIGVRMALGARRDAIVRGVVRTAAGAGLVGVAAGLVAALLFGRVLDRLLFQVPPTDPTILVAAIGAVAVTVGAACWIPARRAARLDPIDLLRHE